MTTTTDTTRLATAVEALAGADPAWLADFRRRSLESHESLPLPRRSLHLWRYTDPAKILPGDRAFAAPSRHFGDIPAEFQEGTWSRAVAYALCRDGVLLRSALEPEAEKRGLVVADLRAAATSHADVVREHLGSLASTCDGEGAKFDALSAALFPGGAFVRLPRGAVFDRPVKIAHRVGGEGFFASRCLVVAEEGSQASILVDLSQADDASSPLLHEGTELIVGPGARLRVHFVQTLGRGAVHAPVIRARLGRDAVLETVSVALGGGLVKSLQTAELTAAGAETRVLGIVFGDGRGHFDHHTFQDHVAPHTTSDLDYRVVCGDRARSAYTGRLRIGVHGAGASARQSNHNLLLSERARADAIPELEILTNDVVCSHAATVGPVDPEQVHFATSRGIAPEDARRLIVLGFLEPAVARIPEGDALDRVRAALVRRMGGEA